MSSNSTTQTLQILSISTAFLASGGIASLSLFCIPVLASQPASRSLPSTRWLFSRGSHIFPAGGILSCSTFSLLAYSSLPPSASSSSTLLDAVQGKPAYYLTAALLCISIAPLTRLMLPTNFSLIAKNEDLGGSRSAASAAYREKKGAQARSANASVESKDDVSEWRDGSGPQEETERESSQQEDAEVEALLDRFGKLNLLRAVAIGAGGVVGLIGALA